MRFSSTAIYIFSIFKYTPLNLAPYFQLKTELASLNLRFFEHFIVPRQFFRKEILLDTPYL